MDLNSDKVADDLANCDLNDEKTDKAEKDTEKEEKSSDGVTTSNDDLTEDDLRRESESKLTEEEKRTRKNEAEQLKIHGNELFKSGEYNDALENYVDALDKCPLEFENERSILFSNLAACYQHLDDKETAIEKCSKALELNANYVKARSRRAQLYEQTEKLDEALEDYKMILSQDPSHNDARAACRILPGRIYERNEKMKTEMLGKLKDLGNLILRPFGLSTENFQLQQDPNSGGYSVNFNQKPQN